MGRVISTCIQFIDAFSKPSQETLKSMRKLSSQAKATGKSIQNAGNTIASAGSSLTKTVTAPIVGVGVAAVKTAADFENAMAKVGTIADTTQTPMNKLKKQVKELSNTVGVGVSDIAEAQYQAISAGVETSKSVSFVSTAVKAAKGGFTDTTTAVDGLTTVLNAYGLEANKATVISDQMLMAQNYGKTSFGDMASSMGKVIPIASSLNVSTKELFGSIAVLTKNGIATSEAVTGLKAAYSNILKPSADASKTAEKLGLDFSSAHLQSVGWAKFLDEIKVKTGGNAETMAKLFGSTEALNSVTVLAGKGSADFAEALTLMGKAGGSTQAAYEKMLTPTEKMNISINKVKNSLIQFGAALTPVFDKIAVIIGKVGDKLNGLSKKQIDTIVKFAGIAAVVGPVLLIFGRMVSTVGTVVRTFGMVTGAIAKAQGVMALITSPAGIVIAVLAAVAVAAFLIIKNWDKIKPVVMKVKDAFMGVMPQIKQTISTAIKAIMPIIQTLISTFKEFLPKAINVAKQVITSITPVIKTIVSTIATIVPIIARTFVSVAQKLMPVVRTIGSIIKAAIPVVGKLFAAAFTFVGNTITKIMPYISKIAKVIGSILVFAIKKVSPVVSKMASTFSIVFNSVYNIVRGIVNKLRPLFNLIGNIIKAKMNIVGKVISSTFRIAASVIQSVSGSIKQYISGIIKAFGGVLDFITGVFTGNWSKAWEGVKNIFGGCFQALVGLCKTPINAVIGLINSAISGINGISVDIPDGIPGVGGKHIGFSIPTIPALAKGTPNWLGGLAQINEKGGEIVDLPKGSRVYPHDESVSIAKNTSNAKLAMLDRRLAKLEGGKGKANGKKEVKITIPKLADQIIVKDQADIDAIAEQIATNLKNTALNMGVC